LAPYVIASFYILDKSLNPKVINVSLIGNHVFCDDRSFVWNSFMNFLATISFNPQTTAQPQIDHAPTQSIKKFTSISLEGQIDLYSTFSEKHLDFMRNFDMELIGKFKINTVPNILRSDAQPYQIILASILKGSVHAVEMAHEDRQLIYSRLLWLLPPLLLRNSFFIVNSHVKMKRGG